ncbi:tetratricopeptide repeat protein [Desulfobacterota bacterium AH_259_B03_O07]|nr:tetratricopeptide repeat protein [Desulfobacterota bacterium AH_259_B03_O07]
MDKDEPTYAYCQKVTWNLCKLIILLIPLSNLAVSCGYLSPLLLIKDPLTPQEHNNLGVAYEKEAKYDLAIKQYKKAFDMNSDLIVPLVNIGNAYLKRGNYSEAEKYYLRALDKDEYNLEASNNLASIFLITEKDYEKGLKIIISAVANNEGFPVYAMDTIGILYSRLGNMDKAKFFLIKACEKTDYDNSFSEEINKHLQEIGEKGCAKY